MLDISGVIDIGPFYSTSKNFLCRCEFKFDAKRLSLRALLPWNKDHRKTVPGICLKAAIGLANLCRVRPCRWLTLRIVLAPNDGRTWTGHRTIAICGFEGGDVHSLCGYGRAVSRKRVSGSWRRAKRWSSGPTNTY
jgi:hypothetical protein